SVALSPGGELLAFNNNGDPWWRRGPNPHGSWQIWVAEVDTAARTFRKVVDQPGRNGWPMWERSEGALPFVSGRDGAGNGWRQPLRGGEAERLTEFTDGRCVRPTISPDGAYVVFERDFGLWRAEVATGKSAPLAIRIHPDTSR